ncbi:MAG: hypothetical protein WDN00_08105, partial [Limisphaerales bacterium]
MSEPNQQHLSPNQRAWRRFKQNRPAVLSAWFLVLLLLTMAAWPLALKFSNAAFSQTHNPDQLS